jgi:hypothetical protein
MQLLLKKRSQNRYFEIGWWVPDGYEVLSPRVAGGYPFRK